MNQQSIFTIAALASSALAASCGAAQSKVEDSGRAAEGARPTQGNSVSDQQLPINQRFSNLDEYLAWLRKTEEPVDGGWYKEIRPGVYELQTSANLHLDVPSTVQKVFTREELEKKFGFKN